MGSGARRDGGEPRDTCLNECRARRHPESPFHEPPVTHRFINDPLGAPHSGSGIEPERALKANTLNPLAHSAKTPSFYAFLRAQARSRANQHHARAYESVPTQTGPKHETLNEKQTQESLNHLNHPTGIL